MNGEIDITGARTNNLQSVDLALPLGKATMLVGVSGSGKSSLLADTLAAEANERMRRFLRVHQSHLGDGDVPAFIGPVPACIHFGQGSFRASRRTTVATSSGLLSLLRSYFRRFSKPWSDEAKAFVPEPSSKGYGSWISNYYKGKVSVWAVVSRWERTDGMAATKLLRRHGVKHAGIRSETDTGNRREQARVVELEKFKPLSKNVRHLIEAEIGGGTLPEQQDEILSLLHKAFDIGRDVIVEFSDGKNLPDELHTERGVLLDSSLHWVHPMVRLPFAPASDALLSFNSPLNPRSGACPMCQGLGTVRSVPVDLLVVHPERSLHKGAMALWTEKNYRYVNIQHETIQGLRGLRGFNPNKAWKHLGSDARDLILFGSDRELVADVDPKTGRKVSAPRPFPGFVPTILRRAEGGGASARSLQTLTIEGPCTQCKGTRWSRAARALRLGKWTVPSLLSLSFDELEKLASPSGQLKSGLPKEAHALASGLRVAAEAFVSAGLGHLSGDRGMTTLSEGESRRSRVAALLRTQGSGLGLLLDEPARGLHEEDVTRLVGALADLKKRHTLIINEHRISLARAVDHVVEVGPGAGTHGGQIVNSGTPKSVFTSDWHPEITRAQLSVSQRGSWLTIDGARIHTLKDIGCRIPLGRFVCITGVSGSGKSSFIRGILLPSLLEELPGKVECEGFVWPDGSWKRVAGTKGIQSVLALETRSPSTQRRSTVATLLGLADSLRRIFAESNDAKRAKLKATDFGWNAGNGRCQTCLGIGEAEDGDRWVSCPHCGGRRFGEEVLGVRVEGLNVAELLELPITELQSHSFADLAGWLPTIHQLVALDLSYLTLSRRVDRLSGGEHQRLRVARALAGEKAEGLFLVLDEPSAGLHPRDVAKLLAVLDRVVAEGRNTVVLVEHNIDLIRASDWVIDFGPGGGPAGGQLVGQGPPTNIAKLKTPTGRVLRKKSYLSITHPPKRQPSRGQGANDNRDVSQQSAQNGRSWLKRLLGEEATAEDIDPVDFEGLAVEFDAKQLVARPYEIAGLDTEIARLLLDVPDDELERPERFARRWSETLDAQIRIHPLVEELRVWGNDVPSAVLKKAEERMKHMGLDTDAFPLKQNNLRNIRADGKRFQPKDDSLSERLRCVRDALGIGGGYVELANSKDGVLATLQMRQLDLDIPAIAPLSASSASLSRLHPAGRCPCCEGTGHVPSLDNRLIIASEKTDPTSEKFLTPEAFGILRGVRRSDLLPFLRRMTAEGLWPKRAMFEKLTAKDRNILLHGYWHRPGPGSFLKSARANPEDVRSWLRWNGLYRATLSELERSKSADWVSDVQRTARRVQCPVCAGTGLQPHSQAIRIGGQSLFDLVRKGTVKGLGKALKEFDPPSRRSLKTRQRILYCLEPVTESMSQALLKEPVDDPKVLRAVFDRTVRKMTRLKIVG